MRGESASLIAIGEGMVMVLSACCRRSGGRTLSERNAWYRNVLVIMICEFLT